MSIFDDLSNNSYLSKKATKKQHGAKKSAGGVGKQAQSHYTPDYATEADTEFSSELSRGALDTEYGTDMTFGGEAQYGNGMTSGEDTELASDFTFGGTDEGMSWHNKIADEEIASDMTTERSQYGTQTYSHAGVAFNKLSEREAVIDYSGLLGKSGANEVIAVYGYGSNQNWENVSMVNLTKDASGKFIATVPIESGKNVNIAFKDAAQNWDNNSGLNYTFVN